MKALARNPHPGDHAAELDIPVITATNSQPDILPSQR
jgi:hypothetical protein